MSNVDTRLLQLIALIGEGDDDAQDSLDELVHDAKGAEAAEINNQGVESQVAYLLGLPPEQLPPEVRLLLPKE